MRFLILLLTLLGLGLPLPALAVDINGQLRRADLETLSADPSSPTPSNGRIYLNTVSNKAKYFSNSAWLTVVDTTNTLLNGAVQNPMVSLGDLIYGASAGTPTALSGNTTSTKKFLTQTGTGTISAVPAWGTVADADLPTTLSGHTLATPTLSSYADVTEVSAPASPAASTLRVYAKSDDKLYTLNPSGVETQVGSGSGEKNYISKGTSTAAGWAASGAGVTATTDTSAADLPDPSVGTALLVTGVSGFSAYAFYNFTLDPADYGKKLKVALDQACGLSGALTAIANCAANDFRVDVYSCTVAWSGSPATTCSGTTTRLPLSTDLPSTVGTCSAGTSCLPALTGTYRTTFDAPGSAAKNIQLRVGLNSTNTHAVAAANVVVGPGVVTQSATVTQWQSYTPTWTNWPTSTSSGQWRRVGDSMEIFVQATASGVATGAIIGQMPSGYTINTSALTTGANNNAVLGTALFNHSAGNYYTADVIYGSTGFFFASHNVGSSWSATIPVAGVSGDVISYRVTVPIAEWAGSGTVNLAYGGTATATVSCDTPNGHGSTNTKIRRYTNCTSTGTAITYADSATLGASYTINEPGVYSMTTSDKNSAAADVLGLSVNTTAPTTAIQSISTSERLLMFEGATNANTSGAITAKLNAGDVVRVHDDGTPNTTAAYAIMKIAKVVNDPTAAVGFASADANNAGLVSTGTQTFAGLKTLATGLSFGQSTLNFYQEDDATLASVTFTPNGSTSTAVSGVAIKITRIGRAVTLNWTRGNTATCQSASTHIDSGTALPTWARPAAATQGPAIIWTNGSTWQWGDIAVATNGTISFYRDPGSSAFANAATCGFDQGSWTFHI